MDTITQTELELRDKAALAVLPEIVKRLKIHPDLQGEWGDVAYAIGENFIAARRKLMQLKDSSNARRSW